MSDEIDELLVGVIHRALSLGHEREAIFMAVQEVGIVAKRAVPGNTITDPTATDRFLHLATVGMLYEKGMLTERKQR